MILYLFISGYPLKGEYIINLANCRPSTDTEVQNYFHSTTSDIPSVFMQVRSNAFVSGILIIIVQDFENVCSPSFFAWDLYRHCCYGATPGHSSTSSYRREASAGRGSTRPSFNRELYLGHVSTKGGPLWRQQRDIPAALLPLR